VNAGSRGRALRSLVPGEVDHVGNKGGVSSTLLDLSR
jgi:hypothetical protein